MILSTWYKALYQGIRMLDKLVVLGYWIKIVITGNQFVLDQDWLYKQLGPFLKLPNQ